MMHVADLRKTRLVVQGTIKLAKLQLLSTSLDPSQRDFTTERADAIARHADGRDMKPSEVNALCLNCKRQHKRSGRGRGSSSRCDTYAPYDFEDLRDDLEAGLLQLVPSRKGKGRLSVKTAERTMQRKRVPARAGGGMCVRVHITERDGETPSKRGPLL